MRKRSWFILFCALFLLICLIPGLATLFLGPGEASSNELLAKKPKLWNGGSLNFDVLSDSTAYFDTHFALRPELITANSVLTAALFRESAGEDVLLGKDGWLYYSDTLRDYEGSDPMSERQIRNAAHTLALIREYAQSRGIRFVFTAAPNKNTLYPESMPERYARHEGPSDLEHLAELLKEEDVPYCDLVSVLSESGETLYYRTDSHWTWYGSALAHDALMRQLQRPARLAEEEFGTTLHKGDLYEMLCPAGGYMEEGPILARERKGSWVGSVRGEDDMLIETASPDGTGCLLMFRDSFGNTLHMDLAEDFASARFSRAMPYDLTLLEEETDTLIIEIVERNLPRLAASAPIMPGPVRTVPEELRPGTGKAKLEMTKSTIPGLICYQGSLESVEPDTDSPVYLLLDGTAYEASPVGKTEGSFTLHAPEASEIAVLVRCGVEWMVFDT